MTTRINNLCSTHQRKPSFEPCDTCNRLTVERLIAFRCIGDLLGHGYALTVADGDDYVLEASTDPKAVFEAMFSTDMDHLLAHKKLQDGAGFHGEHSHFVLFIYGNSGWDVISDYSVALEPALVTALPLSEQLDLIIGDGWLYDYAGVDHGINSLLDRLSVGSYDTEQLETFGKQILDSAAAEVISRKLAQ